MPVLLKQIHSLNYTTIFSIFYPPARNDYFLGMKSTKAVTQVALSPDLLHTYLPWSQHCRHLAYWICRKLNLLYKIRQYRQISTAFAYKQAKLQTITQNPILSRKTHTITQKSAVLRDSILPSPIAIFTAVSPNAKKRSPPATPVNPSKLKIPWFQAISLYFCLRVRKFLWHQLLIAACAAVRLWWLLPLLPHKSNHGLSQITAPTVLIELIVTSGTMNIK